MSIQNKQDGLSSSAGPGIVLPAIRIEEIRFISKWYKIATNSINKVVDSLHDTLIWASFYLLLRMS